MERRQLASSDSDRARSERMADRLHGGSKLGRGVLRAPSVTDLQHCVPRAATLPPGASPEVRFAFRPSGVRTDGQLARVWVETGSGGASSTPGDRLTAPEPQAAHSALRGNSRALSLLRLCSDERRDSIAAPCNHRRVQQSSRAARRSKAAATAGSSSPSARPFSAPFSAEGNSALLYILPLHQLK